MTIIALPSDTVRLLGSAVTITSPCDLVKELLDNAIDSRATSVDISISADTVSKVSVRDNGHGIQVADFQALGRNAHTSKLTSFDQLQARAAQTLGFRGVALACASSLAVVYIVTRVLGDPVASRFQLRAGQGGGQSRQPVSAPIGTMVQATHLFKNLPARRHNVVASRHKTLAQIHQLLKSYALARPYLRLSFKVVGDTSQSWSYSPTASSSVKEAVLQIFGVQLARNCAHVATNPCPRESLVFKTDADPVSTLTFDAFIPKRGFDVDAIKDKGVYISVDQRPLSATKGFAKKMVRILKSHLARAGIRTGVSSGPQATPFMHLNITCPPGSYDPNVSPLKDEVLFANEKGLLDSFDEFCRKVYNKEVSMVSYQDSTSQSYAPDTSGMQLASQFSCSSNHRKDSAFLPRLATRRLPTTVNERVDEVSVKTKTPVFRLGTELYEQKTRQQSDAQGSELIEAAMRTIDKVNMARTVSNETDHEFARATVKVKIPPRPANTAASLQRSKAPTFLSEDIHRYFGPKHNNNFLIASDETATSNSVGADGAGTCAAALSKRPPLQSLGNSTLNCLREKTAEALEPALGDAEPEILRPFHLPRGDLDAPFTRRGQSIVDSSPEDGLHASPPHPVDFLEPRAVVPDFGSSPRVIEQSRRERGLHWAHQPARY
ncbi:hypothetical protein CDD82_7151 [Ophiocordyceps australis]|uniref:DNA mismatch repair protein S5 domain-containing protein n=1 Tax=Ophiocordyceps australis TaxID=1399860 RepID=A0A2C5XX24_9HYPO|nr:hypothetical protein CDD82_7151 [Ophiocordyceps australis]